MGCVWGRRIGCVGGIWFGDRRIGGSRELKVVGEAGAEFSDGVG